MCSNNTIVLWYWCYYGSYIHYLSKMCSLSVSRALAVNNNLHGIFSPPCGKSAEYLHVPVTTQSLFLPLKNSEHTHEILQGKCPITVPFFITATAYLSPICWFLCADKIFTNCSIPNSVINVISTYTAVFLKCTSSHLRELKGCTPALINWKLGAISLSNR